MKAKKRLRIEVAQDPFDLSDTQPGDMQMSKVIKLTAFILLIIGTVGLLVNEFVSDWGRSATLIFAIFNCIGLLILAIEYFAKKGGQ